MNLHSQSPSGYAMVTLHSPTPPPTPRPKKTFLVHAFMPSQAALMLPLWMMVGEMEGLTVWTDE